MSRIGRQPVPIPQGVDVQVDAQKVFVKGPLGALTRPIPPDIKVAVADGKAVVQRTADTRQHRALHGLVRNEIRNMIEGVTKGFERVLEITGVGYKAALSGRTLSLSLGFTHPIAFPLPEGIEAKVDKQTVVTIRGPVKNGGNVTAAAAVGRLVAERALKANVTAVVFDRGGYKYHGRIKALAEAAREKGLKF